MVKKSKKQATKGFSILEQISVNLTNWVGTPYSILLHSIFFIGIFSLYFFGVSTEEILLVLTTLVSLEAIYLAIFIQMTVNRNTASLEAVEDEIEDIQEDVEDLEEDLDQKDLDKIEGQLQIVLQELEAIRKNRMV